MNIKKLLILGVAFFVSCTCDDDKKNTYKYKEGEVVYMKPDSLKVTITDRFHYDGNMYTVKFFKSGTYEEIMNIKEYEIFGSTY